jgi:hypothetical protein
MRTIALDRRLACERYIYQATRWLPLLLSTQQNRTQDSSPSSANDVEPTKFKFSAKASCVVNTIARAEWVGITFMPIMGQGLPIAKPKESPFVPPYGSLCFHHSYALSFCPEVHHEGVQTLMFTIHDHHTRSIAWGHLLQVDSFC